MDDLDTMLWRNADPDVKAAAADMGLRGDELKAFLRACNTADVAEYDAQFAARAAANYEAMPWAPHVCHEFVTTHGAFRTVPFAGANLEMSYLYESVTDSPIPCITLTWDQWDEKMGAFIPHLDLDFEVYGAPGDLFEDCLVDLARRVYAKHGAMA